MTGLLSLDGSVGIEKISRVPKFTAPRAAGIRGLGILEI
jgi:hypothetical protein